MKLFDVIMIGIFLVGLYLVYGIISNLNSSIQSAGNTIQSLNPFAAIWGWLTGGANSNSADPSGSNYVDYSGGGGSTNGSGAGGTW